MGIITNIEKIEIINQRLSNIQIHIDILSKNILDNPEADIIEKPTRQSILQDFLSKKRALNLKKEVLTNQG